MRTPPSPPSPASTPQTCLVQGTLVYQGGVMTPEEVAAFEADPLAADKIRMRLSDEEGKMPGWQVRHAAAVRRLHVRAPAITLSCLVAARTLQVALAAPVSLMWLWGAAGTPLLHTLPTQHRPCTRARVPGEVWLAGWPRCPTKHDDTPHRCQSWTAISR